MTIAIYPGTFDPVTNGHLNIISRGAKIFDQLIVAVVAENYRKKESFSIAKRIEMLQQAIDDLSIKNVAVKKFSGLLVDFAKENSVSILIRGLRVVSDFEYELQQAELNRTLNPQIETIFLPTDPNQSFISSSIIREISSSGGDVSLFVPSGVKKELDKLYKKEAL